VRSADDEIPSGERLFRTVSRDHLDGDRVLEFAIDSEGTSCKREAYCPLKDAPDPTRPGVAAVTAGDLPLDILLMNGNKYDVIAVDCPEPARDHHCEIRWRSVEDRPSKAHRKIKSGSARLELKRRVAALMTVLIPPG
jgi:hypothetical protein